MITAFQQKYRGRFVGILRWHQLDELWERVKTMPEGWYVYFIGEPVPTRPIKAENLYQFIDEVDKLLHRDHHHDYCGIVYVDDKENPTMIKIFDPNNLGYSCGSSGKIVPPRWLLSRLAPQVIEDDAPVPASRRRWWQQLFSQS
jgi:hypothetical protein